MLDAQGFARMLAPAPAKNQISLGTVTGITGGTVQFVLDGEDPTSTLTRTAATLADFSMGHATTGSRVLVAKVNASFVVLGILA